MVRKQKLTRIEYLNGKQRPIYMKEYQVEINTALNTNKHFEK